MTELQFVTFEQAKALKELGFPQDMIGGYYSEICKPEVRGLLVHKIVVDTMYASPSLELVAKWLRDEKKMQVEVNYVCDGCFRCYVFMMNRCYSDIKSIAVENKDDKSKFYRYVSYEEALSAGIDKAIKILKLGMKEI